MDGVLTRFLADGDRDLFLTLGESAVLSRRGVAYATVTAAVVPAASDLAVEIGGIEVSVRANATVSREDVPERPREGDSLAAGGCVYTITGVAGASFDSAWHLELSL